MCVRVCFLPFGGTALFVYCFQMGFLTDGTALPWEDAKEFLNYVRQHGILQFLSIYHERKDSENDRLLWGDEIEFMMVKMDRQTRVSVGVFCKVLCVCVWLNMDI